MITAMREDDRDRDRDPLTEKIIAACYQVHNELGPGFVERIYLSGLKVALKKLELKHSSLRIRLFLYLVQ